MKISYKKQFDVEGTCYSQMVSIPKEKRDVFLQVVNNSIDLTLKTINSKRVLSNQELRLQMYLKPIKRGLNFTTLTTKDYIFNAILGVKIKNRNTVIKVN
jgi:hypothetical protein